MFCFREMDEVAFCFVSKSQEVDKMVLCDYVKMTRKCHNHRAQSISDTNRAAMCVQQRFRSSCVFEQLDQNIHLWHFDQGWCKVSSYG